MGYSVRTQNWRCVAWFNVLNDSIEFTELYDMEDDNIEKTNLTKIADYRDIELRLLEMLKAYKYQKYSLFERIKY